MLLHFGFGLPGTLLFGSLLPAVFVCVLADTPSLQKALAASRDVWGELAMRQLNGPHYVNGYLPIVQWDYREDGSVYREEVFACVAPPSDPTNTAAFARFSLCAGRSGKVAAAIGSGRMKAEGGVVRDECGQARVRYDAAWRWNGEQQRLGAELKPGQGALLIVYGVGVTGESLQTLDEEVYQAERRRCADYWRQRLRTGMQVVTPEPYVNNVYRALLIGTLLLEPLDMQGRPMYLPPNTAGNAFFLWMLRYLLIQDWDEDDDGVPETLHLLFATPRDWLRDGAVLQVRQAPPAFGPVAVTVHSHLKRGVVVAEVVAPPNPPAVMQIRFRLPGGWHATSASINGKPGTLDGRNTLDLSGQRNRIVVRVAVRQGAP